MWEDLEREREDRKQRWKKVRKEKERKGKGMSEFGKVRRKGIWSEEREDRKEREVK